MVEYGLKCEDKPKNANAKKHDDRSNVLFEEGLDGLRSKGEEGVKKLYSIAILDESPGRRKLAVALLLGLATKIVNSERTLEDKEVQLAHDIFHFIISYMLGILLYIQNSGLRKTQEDSSLIEFILSKRDAYRSLILKLDLYPKPKNPVSVESWDRMIKLASKALMPPQPYFKTSPVSMCQR